jgi:HPt (histidine-containing phosphotransfer) domain-containing protein
MELDKKKIAAELMIDEDVLNELLHDFLSQAEDAIAKLSGACGAGNFDEIKDLAHFIKGAAGNLRITPMHEAAKEIEAYAKEKNNLNVISEKIVFLGKLQGELKKNIGS